MELFKCETCGSTEFIEQDNYRICSFCGNKYENKADNSKTLINSSIELDSDVSALLEKCRKDPARARRYANLILDIDPTNKEALYFLRR